ncbi:HTTM domain-containing protein [Streptomyces sp. NBC_00878]|uniref:HTTM domain-containing protein n=1 Tax=Streptomyces sp. NBC_00878 TaxID=2975854 RepID=UPI00225A02F7|nr:HTTM domain-containing protein [Streptomyces sp. NBC_00878]MCX4907208.1 HTTM domain-containing protein [Streptomyces sp. NBC_00878]
MSGLDHNPTDNHDPQPNPNPRSNPNPSPTPSPRPNPPGSPGGGRPPGGPGGERLAGRISRFDRKYRVDRTLTHAITRVTGEALGPYQSAVIRIGFAGTWLLFLLREFPHREEMYGPDGPWSWDLAQQLIGSNHAFTALMWADGQVWFGIVYALALLSSALLMLGWRTRTMSVLFMIGVLSLQNRSVFMGDGGDNVIHLMAIYLVLTRCGQVWSLDERRERRQRRERRARDARARGARLGSDTVGVVAPGTVGAMAPDRVGATGPDRVGAAGPDRVGAAGPDRVGAIGPDRVGPALWTVLGLALAAATLAGKIDGGFLGGWRAVYWGLWAIQGLWWLAGRYARSVQPRIFLDVVANLVHNAALFVIMAEACLIYATAGWYKIQGSRWQDGTAVYYPLHLDYFSPWPALSDLLSASGTMVMLVTYGTVIVQVAFPFTLFNRRAKNVLLAAMMTEHAVIAVVLGLPFFSLAMIAADAVFLPTSFLRRVGGRAARAREGLFSRIGPTRTIPRPRKEPPRTPETADHPPVGFTA